MITMAIKTITMVIIKDNNGNDNSNRDTNNNNFNSNIYENYYDNKKHSERAYPIMITMVIINDDDCGNKDSNDEI